MVVNESRNGLTEFLVNCLLLKKEQLIASDVIRRSLIQVLTNPMMLNFSDQTRSGVFDMVWPLT